MHQLEGSEPSQTSPPDDSVDPFSLSLYNLSSGHAKQGIEIPVELNGTSLLMELDTGAGVSVIPEETYKKNFSAHPSCRPILAYVHAQDTHSRYTGNLLHT